MGMFDYVKYKGDTYQSKDTPSQTLENYELRDDGTLWLHCYTQKFIDDADALLGFREERSDHYWKFCEDVSEPIYFYRSDTANFGKWIEYLAKFKEGKLIQLERVKDYNP